MRKHLLIEAWFSHAHKCLNYSVFVSAQPSFLGFLLSPMHFADPSRHSRPWWVKSSEFNRPHQFHDLLFPTNRKVLSSHPKRDRLHLSYNRPFVLCFLFPKHKTTISNASSGGILKAVEVAPALVPAAAKGVTPSSKRGQPPISNQTWAQHSKTQNNNHLRIAPCRLHSHHPHRSRWERRDGANRILAGPDQNLSQHGFMDQF